MSKRVGLEASHAAAEAAKMADVDVIAAYPITPQTHIPERLAEMVADGELNAAYIPVESEHSALSACLGAAAVGARTFTATAGQGLELMHEVVYVASSMRYPMVMTVCNRALSAPLSVWGDHSDAMAVRDTGWIQVFCQNSQEAFDMTLWAFRVGEDSRVLLPVMVHFDGFHLSHVTEPVILPEQEEVGRFLPKFHYPFALNPDKPMTHGAFGPPDVYSEAKIAQEVAIRESKAVAIQGFKEFGDIFGRYYQLVESYRAEGAKTLLLTMGSFSETAKIAIDAKKKKGESLGLITLRLWRPFPFEELRQAVKNAETLIVFDRCVSLGGPAGTVASEIRSALYNEKKRPKVVSFVGGLGGRDMPVEDFEYIVDRGREIAEKGSKELSETVGIRGEVTGIRG
ncbi:MAG: pyruvate ferredoxin oxidoreductase [Dehalococcoidia bacterium]|nr:pyruvate ferredoxin oxidoreductase [Dehalococcoidia bacterium]MDH4299711.1 pyruvate ferredoxin oxidoreductase [Dehalococcoidia bacterium]